MAYCLQQLGYFLQANWLTFFSRLAYFLQQFGYFLQQSGLLSSAVWLTTVVWLTFFSSLAYFLQKFGLLSSAVWLFEAREKKKIEYKNNKILRLKKSRGIKNLHCNSNGTFNQNKDKCKLAYKIFDIPIKNFQLKKTKQSASSSAHNALKDLDSYKKKSVSLANTMRHN